MSEKESLVKALEWVRNFGFTIPMPKTHKITLVTAAKDQLELILRNETFQKEKQELDVRATLPTEKREA